MAYIDIKDGNPERFPMCDLPRGAIAVIVGEPYKGTIVFRPYEGKGFVSIHNGRIDGGPISAFSDGCPNMVRVLSPGTTITITL